MSGPNEAQVRKLSHLLEERGAGKLYPNSVTQKGEQLLFVVRGKQGERILGLLGAPQQLGWEGRFYQLLWNDQPHNLWLGPISFEILKKLQEEISWLKPIPLGLSASFGFGDRLGLATPGHIRALRGYPLRPIFAQQSVRELERTNRTSQQVMLDACLGVLQEGFQGGFGADADHIKNAHEIGPFLEAGFTLFTLDPSQVVDDTAASLPKEPLMSKLNGLPWGDLDTSWKKLKSCYLNRSFEMDGFDLTMSEEQLARAVVKYSRAILQIFRLVEALSSQRDRHAFELEISVDESQTPTSLPEHFFVASELKRMGVFFISLAPRFVGKFEKGVDYIGNLERFEEDLIGHHAIARALGPYKLSVHSGSDKFSIYPSLAKHTAGSLHVKTAGTSYLEALRVVAGTDPVFFRELFLFAKERYPQDAKSYHVSAVVERLKHADGLTKHEWTALLDNFDARQVLHVTFGSVLQHRSTEDRLGFRERLLALLKANEEGYGWALEKHFEKHLSPFGWLGQQNSF